jgi:hypothetical protein
VADVTPVRDGATRVERRRAGVTCSNAALRSTDDWDTAKADLTVLVDMLDLRETGEVR